MLSFADTVIIYAESKKNLSRNIFFKLLSDNSFDLPNVIIKS
jgi:hypothetical protein